MESTDFEMGMQKAKGGKLNLNGCNKKGNRC